MIKFTAVSFSCEERNPTTNVQTQNKHFIFLLSFFKNIPAFLSGDVFMYLFF